ncbi:MAG: helix-turn-helix domain-containing protein [Oscillospiraceae bacterium]|nr:helix-turn-helix domain-containing protein [Oscillospiraceae bacterium]
MGTRISDFNSRLEELLDEGRTYNKGAATKTELADAIGITRQSISKYTNGKSSPSLDIAIKIASHYKVSLDYLAGISEHTAIEKDVKQTCMYTGLTEAAVTTLAQINEDKKHPLKIKIISQLIESKKLDDIAGLLEKSLVKANQYSFLYGDGENIEIMTDMLESDEHQFYKVVADLYPTIIQELSHKLKREINAISDAKWETMLEAAENTIEKMETIIQGVGEDNWKAYQAAKIQKITNSKTR